MRLFIPPPEIEGFAEDFLARYHPSLDPPIPIDEILQAQMGVQVVPVKGMSHHDGVEAFCSNDLSLIYIDHDQYMAEIDHRARYTLAHEAGHIHMHGEYLLGLPFEDISGWKQLLLDRNADHSYLETQARMFAKYVLMPRSVVERVWEEQKAILEQQWPPDLPQPNDKTFAAYAANALSEECRVSASAAENRLSRWTTDGY